MARIVSFVVLLAILLVIVALFFRVMAGFLLPLFLAALLVVMFGPLHRSIVVRCQGRERLAAGLTTLAILIIVLAPMLGILGKAAVEAAELASGWNRQSTEERVDKLRSRLGLNLPPADVQLLLDELGLRLRGWADRAPAELPDPLELESAGDQVEALAALIAKSEEAKDAAFEPGENWQDSLAQFRVELDKLALLHEPARFDRQADEVLLAYARFEQDLLGGPIKAWLTRLVNPDQEHMAALRTRLQEFAGPLALGGAQFAGGFLAEFLIGLAVMIVSLYYFLADGPAMIAGIMRLSPLDDRYERQLLEEFTTVSRAVVVATLLSAVVQGVLAGFGYFFAGLDSVFLLTMLTMLFALIPFVGATAVWLPCALWLFLFEDRTTAAVALAVYGALVVSMADNVIKPLVLQGRSNMHPLLALLSVLGGVKAMGPIGIVVGPMVVAFLQPLLVMLQTELKSLGKTETGKAEG
ncbi:MAG: AI-2E family transporter [Pirellulales bacterium]